MLMARSDGIGTHGHSVRSRVALHKGSGSPAAGLLPRSARRLAVTRAVVALCLLLLAAGAVGADSATRLAPSDGINWNYSFQTIGTQPNATFTLTGIFNLDPASPSVTAPDSALWTVDSMTATTITWRYTGGVAVPGPRVWSTFHFTTKSVTGAGTITWVTALTGGAPANGGVAGPSVHDYAMVTVYDNHIGFNDNPATPANEGFVPTDGSTAVPSDVMARERPASGSSATSHVPGANGYDIAGLRVVTGRRLSLTAYLGGHLRRVTPTGAAFTGNDTRKSTAGPYELATQWKVKFYGKFLDLGGAAYAIPCSGETTQRNAWTMCGGSDNPTNNVGWLWPTTTDAWTGGAVAGTAITQLDLLVERNQGTELGFDDAAAEIWFAERVRRRGQQDAQGNYAQHMVIDLTYAE